MQPLDPPPLLQPHYQPSSLIRGGPSQCPASVLSPYGFFRLSFSLYIRTTGSRSSAREPEPDSRLLYAGRRLPSYQVSGRLVPGELKAPGFDEHCCSLRRFNRGSLAFVSLTLTCSGYFPVALTPMLTTTAFDRSSLEWFGTRSWKPIPKDLPSSPVQLVHIWSAHSEPPFRAPAAHSKRSAPFANTVPEKSLKRRPQFLHLYFWQSGSESLCPFFLTRFEVHAGQQMPCGHLSFLRKSKHFSGAIRS